MKTHVNVVVDLDPVSTAEREKTLIKIDLANLGASLARAVALLLQLVALK